MEPVTGLIQVKTKYRECNVEQCNLIRDKALRAVQKILVVENQQRVTVEMWKGKPGGKITFIFDITFLSDGEHESEPVMFTDGPVYDSFERAVHKVLGAQKPVVKTHTATLRDLKDTITVISFDLQFDKAGKATLTDTQDTQDQIQKVEDHIRVLAALRGTTYDDLMSKMPEGAYSSAFHAIQEVQAQVRESAIRGKSLFEEFAKAMISDAARTRLIAARTTGMPPCMAAPYGRTQTVNGHEVPRGITVDELMALVDKSGHKYHRPIWHLAPWISEALYESNTRSSTVYKAAELGMAHLTRDAAVRHATALFTPEKLEKPEDERTDIDASARENHNEGPASFMKKLAAIRINNLRRNIKLDNDALKMIAPDGKTIIVNGHLVQRGITRAEYDAMPVKPADLWLVRLHSCGDMVMRHTGGDVCYLHMDKGLVHLDREDAECHARALFTPDELDVAGGNTNA